MKTNNIFPDDPRLTAYALKEMEPAERAGFEQALAHDAVARQAVAEISATISTLTAALENEPMAPAEVPGAKAEVYTKVVRFPYWTISSLAAACFAVFFIFWQRSEVLNPQKQYIEVALPTSPPATAEPEQPTADESPTAAVSNVIERAEEDAARKKVLADVGAAFKKEARLAVGSVPTTLKDQSKASALGARQDPLTFAVGGDVGAKPAEEEMASVSYYGAATLGSGAADSIGPLGYAAQPSVAATRGHRDMRELYDLNQAPRENPAWVRARTERESNTEGYAYRKDNDYLRVADNPLSTFSVDVDTASYANVRRFLNQGQRPPTDAVRIEELVNYFPCHYPPPAGNAPFAASLEVAGAPWAPAHRLVRIGLKGREFNESLRPAANLVFLLDVSGSMSQANKLPLVKQSLRLLVEKLRPDDRVAIAVYTGASGLALPSTRAAHKAEIMDAIDRLQAEGSTNGAMGIQLAYDIAKANFIPGGVNRVILATDGDFNVGVTSEGSLVRLVEEKAKSGVFLTVLGFGMGNLKDGTLEQLADKGNGNYAYIDTLAEARKTLVEQAGGTLVTIAKDVKIQVEFNPAVVQAYRLIGYENRLLAREDFNNDKVDAGEVGAGHAVTALYEVVPVGVPMPDESPAVDALKYSRSGLPAGRDLSGPAAGQTEMLTVKIRYKEPAGDTSSKLEFPLRDAGTAFAGASPDFKFAAAVAAFGMVLRDSPHKGAASLADVVAWGRAGLASDAGGYRNEFISLVERAQQLVQ